MSYTIGANGSGSAGAIAGGAVLKGLNTVSIGALGQSDTIRLGGKMQINSQISIGLTKAVGGFIVQVHSPGDYVSVQNSPDYYIIPDTVEDFDKELGKIISLHLLKSNT